MQAHFNPLSRRDEALARSLNADYVAQVQYPVAPSAGLWQSCNR